MAMANERGAGRKRKLTQDMLKQIRERMETGETVASLAREYEVSRQTLYASVRELQSNPENVYKSYAAWARKNREFKQENLEDFTARIDYMCKDELCSIIWVDYLNRKVVVENRTNDIVHRAFGIKARPTWEDLELFLEERCFPRGRHKVGKILEQLGLDHYDPWAIVEETKGRMAEDLQWLQISYYAKEGGTL